MDISLQILSLITQSGLQYQSTMERKLYEGCIL
jgi:hypothetical protein